GPNQPLSVFSYYEDRAGTLWIGGANGYGLSRCASGGSSCTTVAEEVIGKALISAIHEDSSGRMWFGTAAGLLQHDKDGWRLVDQQNVPEKPVRVFATTRDGALWMGTAGDGLARYANGAFRRITTADGLPP